MKLLCRMFQYDSESFSDYLSRLSFWNGFSSQYNFLNYLAKLYKANYFYIKPDIHFRVRKAHLILEKILKRNIPKHQLFSMNSFYIPCGEIKICSKCWNEHKYIRFYWRLNNYVKCHIHNEFLFIPNEISFDSKYKIKPAPIFTKKKNTDYRLHILIKAIQHYKESGHCINIINNEIVEHAYLISLFQWVFKFFSTNMDIKLNIGNAIKLIISGEFVGVSINKKMDSIFSTLVGNDSDNEKLVRIITVIRVGETSYFNLRYPYGKPKIEFIDWMNNEILSIDELFYAYIGFGSLRTRRFNYKFKYEVSGFEKLPEEVDSELCQAIYSRSIKRISEKDVDYQQYEEKLNYTQPNPSSLKYNEYLKAIGKKTLDELTIKIT